MNLIAPYLELLNHMPGPIRLAIFLIIAVVVFGCLLTLADLHRRDDL